MKNTARRIWKGPSNTQREQFLTSFQSPEPTTFSVSSKYTCKNAGGGKLKRFRKIPNKIHNIAQVNIFTKMKLHFDPSSLSRRLQPLCRPTFKSLDDWVRNYCFAFGLFMVAILEARLQIHCEIFNAIITTHSFIFFHVFS